MLIKIEKVLSKFESHIINYSNIKSILQDMGYTGINNKITQLIRKGILSPIKKGLYFHKSLFQDNILSKEILANLLLGPSYISFEYALSFHGLIPEAVYTLTSASTKRSKKFNTEFGAFSYKYIKKELFPIGINIEQTPTGNFMIASKEKALCDMVYFVKGVSLRSKVSMINFLEDDLRLDMQALEDIDIKIIKKYYHCSKSNKIAILLKTLKKEI